MSIRRGTEEPSLRVAVVGAGPAGFFTADALLRAPDVACSIDVFDRLPTPYGLVREGVAPDHAS
ncbi:MAG: FAD/NAD(P)-binding protein, partial [Gemmatimonadetes bacterium]|nr:FAD/NAD(P)-binding protein [Gemmatimonadota bacterium]